MTDFSTENNFETNPDFQKTSTSTSKTLATTNTHQQTNNPTDLSALLRAGSIFQEQKSICINKDDENKNLNALKLEVQHSFDCFDAIHTKYYEIYNDKDVKIREDNLTFFDRLFCISPIELDCRYSYPFSLVRSYNGFVFGGYGSEKGYTYGLMVNRTLRIEDAEENEENGENKKSRFRKFLSKKCNNLIIDYGIKTSVNVPEPLKTENVCYLRFQKSNFSATLKKGINFSIEPTGQFEISADMLKLETGYLFQQYRLGQIQTQVNFGQDGIKLSLNLHKTTNPEKKRFVKNLTVKPFVIINPLQGITTGLETSFLFKNNFEISLSTATEVHQSRNFEDMNNSKLECKIPVSESTKLKFGIQTNSGLSKDGCFDLIFGVQRSSFGFTFPVRVPFHDTVMLAGIAIFGGCTIGFKEIARYLNKPEESTGSNEFELEEDKTRAMEQQFLMKTEYEKVLMMNNSRTNENGLVIVNAVLKGVKSSKSMQNDGDIFNSGAKRTISGSSDCPCISESESISDSEDGEDVFITDKDSSTWMGQERDFSMDCTVPVQLRVVEGRLDMNLSNVDNEPGFYDPTNGDKGKRLCLVVTERQKKFENQQKSAFFEKKKVSYSWFFKFSDVFVRSKPEVQLATSQMSKLSAAMAPVQKL